MSGKRKIYTEEFKLQVLREAEAGVPLSELTRKYEIGTGVIYKWRRQLNSSAKNPFPGKGSRNTDKAKIAELERIIGRQAITIEFLKNLNERLKTSGR
jgi:transposase-like protein